MTAIEWYRNTKWNSEIEKVFFEKLNRARSQRDQYLVIQASSLVKNQPEVALQLVDYYFESRNDKFDDMRALLTRAEALLELEKIGEAMAAFQAVLSREEEFSNHISDTYVRYPYIVATREIKSEYENALNVLKKYKDRLAFPLDYFMWYSSRALIENDEESAKNALEVAEVKKSGFRFHQNVGLVGKEHAKTIKKLHKIST